MTRATTIMVAMLSGLTLVGCGDNNDGPAGPPAGSVDLSGDWPELWVAMESGGNIVPGDGPAPPITLAADDLGFSGSTCYLESNGDRTFVSLRLTVQGPDVVGGEIVAKRWIFDPVPADCDGEPDSNELRLTVLGAHVEDGPVRVVGSWIRPVPAGLEEGTFTLERNP